MPHQPPPGQRSARSVRFPTDADFKHARAAVARYLDPTPLIHSGDTLLKLECLQPTGSFKVRGAFAAMSAAPEGARILAASAGNHALGIAFAAERLNLAATVVISETASPAKRAKLERLPVTLIRHGQTIEAAEAFAVTQAATDPDIHYISPYNDPLVIAGQATIVDELIGQVPPGPLCLVVPVGGGGLLAGIAWRASQLRVRGWDIEVVGVESSESLAVSTAVAAGRTLEVTIGETIADGLSGNIEAGSITVDLIRQHVARLTTVGDAQLRRTIRWLICEHGLVVEAAGAAAIAAIRDDSNLTDERTTIAVVSGRNIAHHLLEEIFSESANHRSKDFPS